MFAAKCNNEKSSPAALRKQGISPKLEITQPGDEFEEEADKMADQALSNIRGMGGSGSPPPAGDANKGDGLVQFGKFAKTGTGMSRSKIMPKAERGSSRLSGAFGSKLSLIQNSGQPLSGPVRNQMETGFGADFSGVRVHNNSQSAQLANDIKAQAFTHGQDIYFNKGKLDTQSQAGKRLLAHELSHTLQQKGRPGYFARMEETGEGQDAEETALPGLGDLFRRRPAGPPRIVNKVIKGMGTFGAHDRFDPHGFNQSPAGRGPNPILSNPARFYQGDTAYEADIFNLYLPNSGTLDIQYELAKGFQVDFYLGGHLIQTNSNPTPPGFTGKVGRGTWPRDSFGPITYNLYDGQFPDKKTHVYGEEGTNHLYDLKIVVTATANPQELSQEQIYFTQGKITGFPFFIFKLNATGKQGTSIKRNQNTHVAKDLWKSYRH